MSNTVRVASKMARLMTGSKATSAGSDALLTGSKTNNWNNLTDSIRRQLSSSTPTFFSSTSGSSTTFSDRGSSPRILLEGATRARIATPEPDPGNLTSWLSSTPKKLILPKGLGLSDGADGGVKWDLGVDAQNVSLVEETQTTASSTNQNNDKGKDGDRSNNSIKDEMFLSAISSETLQNLMRSLFYIPLTEGGCALGFFTRICMRDLASQWTDELQEALTEIAGKETKDLDDTWACGFVTSCSVFRKATNVTEHFPLVSALSGKTFLFDFDNGLNYNFSDPFTDVAFVQLTPQQIYKAQKFDFNFLPMNLSLYHDIYDKSIDSLINGKDVVIAKQLQGYVTQVTKDKVGADESLEDVMRRVSAGRDAGKNAGRDAPTHSAKSEDTQKTIAKTKRLLDDSVVSGTAPAVNRSGELVGIGHRKLNGQDVLLPTKMLSLSIASDLNSQIGSSEDPLDVSRPQWMDFQIRYADLHDLGLLVHPLAHDNDKMIDFVDWPFYETWYQRTAPINNLTFVLTEKHLYLRPENEFFGDEPNHEGEDLGFKEFKDGSSSKDKPKDKL